MIVLHIFSTQAPTTSKAWNDFGVVLTGYPSTFKGRPSTAFNIPDIVSQRQGFEIELVKDNWYRRFKGILHLRREGYNYPWIDPEQTAALELDDVYMEKDSCPEPIPCPEPEPEPEPETDPLEIVKAAFAKYPDFEDRRKMLREVALNLNANDIDSGGRGAFGMLKKTTGHNCEELACDIIAAGSGTAQGQWDIMTDNGPIWSGPKTIADGIRIDELIIPVP